MTDGFGMGFGFGGGLMWLFWIVAIILIVWGVKLVLGIGDRPRNKEGSALDILEKRYAKGEIDQAEFEQKRKDLND
ncbi:MAG: SHOCT domain-containing protein [Gammaproteobacteria bacterium]|nr:SHOCT domain-containing protein [Gammaproteobacteria bacterium]